MVPTQLWRSVWNSLDAISLVDHHFHSHHHSLARYLPLVGHLSSTENVGLPRTCVSSSLTSLFHRIPIGVFAFAVSFSGPLSSVISPKFVLLSAQGLLVIATILLGLADSPEKYFSFVLPAFILGSSGAMFTYTHTKYVFIIMLCKCILIVP